MSVNWLEQLAAKLDMSPEKAAYFFFASGGVTQPEHWLSLSAEECAILVAAARSAKQGIPDAEEEADARVGDMLDRVSEALASGGE